MSTKAQISANQANSQRSSGPSTQEGKAASSMNNYKYGFCGNFMVLALESQEDFDAFLQSPRDEHQPATPTEDILVTKMAEHYWISRRAQHLQDVSLGQDISPTQWKKEFTLYLRYQTTHDRAFHKSLAQLLKLRAERRKVEIGFESQERSEAEKSRQQSLRDPNLHLVNPPKIREFEPQDTSHPDPANRAVVLPALQPVLPTAA